MFDGTAATALFIFFRFLNFIIFIAACGYFFIRKGLPAVARLVARRRDARAFYNQQEELLELQTQQEQERLVRHTLQITTMREKLQGWKFLLQDEEAREQQITSERMKRRAELMLLLRARAERAALEREVVRRAVDKIERKFAQEFADPRMAAIYTQHVIAALARKKGGRV